MVRHLLRRVALTTSSQITMAIPVTSWISCVGKWIDEDAGRVTYVGPQAQTPRPYGICMSGSQFTAGTVRATITMPSQQISSEGPSAGFLLGYSHTRNSYAVGIGGHNRKYTLVRHDPVRGSWALVFGIGTASDLKIGHRYSLSVRISGSTINLFDDGNLVFEQSLPSPLEDDGRLALFAWGDARIEYSNVLIEDNINPADDAISEVLERFDRESVYRVWTKALDRRSADPDGAITSARTLLESVCKHILEKNGKKYDPKADLPDLYSAAAAVLTIAPNQQTVLTLRKMLGGCQQVVSRLGELRNKVGDAHGRGAQPANLAPRHASLAVNLAGAMATFLVETALQRDGGGVGSSADGPKRDPIRT